MSSIKAAITESMKSAMKAKEKETLATIRLIMAEFKRVEVDERIELDDARCLAILDKMLKQRKDSISQFEEASRHDLADKEKSEMAVIQRFLPEPLSEAALADLIKEAIESTGAAQMSDMGKVMALLKPQCQGRADMGQLSNAVKAALAG